MPTPAAPRHETLLAHREWVHALARSLTSGSADADDVEQQTWAAALTSAPQDARSIRAWLTTVAVNSARRLRRTDARQRSRAERRPPPAPSRSAAELAEEADTHARVVTAVVALDEPYREAILLRYFEGLGVRDVAAHSGVPLETARARLRRARALLRDRLADDFGPERPWHLAVLALADRAPARTTAASAATITGGVLVGSKLVVAASVVIVAGLVVWLAQPGKSEPNVPQDPVAAATAADAAPTTLRRDPVPRPRADVPSPSPAPTALPTVPATAAAAPPSPALTARERIARALESSDPLLANLDFRSDDGPAMFGRLADATDCPIALTTAAESKLRSASNIPGLALSGRSSGERALSLLTGVFGLTFFVEDERVVVATQTEKVSAATVVVVPTRPARHPTAAARGVVRDGTGQAVAGAQVVLFDGVARVVAASAADGTWSFERRGLGVGVETFVLARAPGRLPSLAAKITSPLANEPIELTLRGAAGGLRLHVTSDAGDIEGAYVTLGPEGPVEARAADGGIRWELPVSTVSDPAGVAALDGLAPGVVTLRVWVKGLEPATPTATVAEGETVDVNVRLTKRPSLAATVAAARVSAKFDGARLHDVVSFLGRVHRLNIIVLPDLAERATAPVSLAVTDEPLDSALRMLCDAVGGATFEVREADNVIVLMNRAPGK